LSSELLHVLEHFAELVRHHVEHEQREPVRRPLSPAELQELVDLTVGEPTAMDQLVEQLKVIVDHTPATASPRFFNQLFAGRDATALLGDLLASVLNNSMYTWKVAGVHVLIEMMLVERMGKIMGFEDPDGTFTPGGSLSNFTGMLLARNTALPGIRDHGGDTRPLRIYSSVDGHYSVRKGVGMLGLGRQNLVLIDVDERGQMIPEALNAAIERDIAAGLKPIMINATLGTTVLGAFDPFQPIADIAERHGIWLHADAAYGGTLIFHPDFVHHFDGVHRADSITWDAHKLMGVPLTSSVILVREKGLLTQNLHEPATYLFQEDSQELNAGTRSLQCGRRNDVLKLWTTWKAQGDAGFAQRIDTLRSLTLRAREHVLARPHMKLTREPESLNLVFTVEGVPADRLCAELNRQERAMISHAYVDDQPVVRLVTLNPSVAPHQIDELFEQIDRVASSLRPASGE